ncbi:sigma-54-dependent Fis family transcriptional regulator [Peribacillus butanolivorans]|uniref:PAS domain S-box protein n=1 Tax=Peribacillus butanolivorans TaxID=421767 RepID=A0AAX0S8D5_9BACI|nr:sigma 54-interacting transcriptional regulator [Peribacillus butanolivorans]AXN41231.1 PAS domain S-box protein [Peribacillus butanolivorans]PEJ37562.1 sigma-54-dependent Fis family transcriptional regulator [Peribacillus butanolivorans]
MANVNKTVQLELVKAILEELPFGILVTKNEKEIVLYNRILSEGFSEDQFDQQTTLIIKKNLLSAVNTPIYLNGNNVIVRKEIVQVGDEEYQFYFLLFTNNKNDFLNIDNHEEILFKDIIEFAYDGLVMVDTEGYVQMLSHAYADFLGVDQESSIGKHVTEIIENTRMHLVAKTGKQEVAELQKIKDNYIIATRSPILKQGKIVGAVGKILFKNVGQFTALSKRVNLLEIELKKYKGDFRERNKASYTFDHIMGKSPALMEIKVQARIAAKSDSNVLILGESGTGKELFAHSIHNESRRAMGVFVKVNCAAIPAELLESELFGYEEGSFTGAKKGGKAGKFEAADGGTIFLDEIGELPLHMQVKLLRVLQEKEIERVGSTGSVQIDVRVIAATNRNLEEMVSKGEFRLDLYYRLKVMQIHVPSLRKRLEDVEILVNYFVEKYQNLMKKRVQGMSDQALRQLRLYKWPGNIRELENIIERALNIVEEEEMIDSKHLPEEITGHKELVPIRTLAEVMEETERATIFSCLEMTSGNKSETAKRLGVSRTTLYEKMNKYGL